MRRTETMLNAHPQQAVEGQEALVRCIEACYDCAQTCTSCADACLGEQNVSELVPCIRLNLDCADICEATGRLVTRRTATQADHVARQLQACVAACRACGVECERHAGHMEHCRVCAEACRRCEQACEALLGSLAA